jgi:hypothetical protein
MHPFVFVCDHRCTKVLARSDSSTIWARRQVTIEPELCRAMPSLVDCAVHVGFAL